MSRRLSVMAFPAPPLIDTAARGAWQQVALGLQNTSYGWELKTRELARRDRSPSRHRQDGATPFTLLRCRP